MNRKDKERLRRLYSLMDAVPFAGGSTASLTVAGLAGYEQDMRAFIPAVRQIMYGILADGLDDWEEGIDYHDPDLSLDALEAWIEKRKCENWQEASDYSFRHFYDDFRNGLEKGETTK